MLKEFAIMPTVFVEELHTDKEQWRACLRELCNGIFPRTAASPVVVSNLYNESWLPEVLKIINSIEDPKSREICQRFVKKLNTVLVCRAACFGWPENEADWQCEALESAKLEPIERIVTGTRTDNPRNRGSEVRSLDEVEDSGFWDGISSSISPKLLINEQVSLLRKVCVHAHWLAVSSKYIFGGGDDETDFVVSLFKQALSRPRQFGNIDLELHTSESNQQDSEPKPPLTKRVGCISSKLSPLFSGTKKAKLYVWAIPNDRYVLAGTYAFDGSGNRKKKPRWGVSMNHIARARDTKRGRETTSWNILTQDELLAIHKRLTVEEAVARPDPFELGATVLFGGQEH